MNQQSRISQHARQRKIGAIALRALFATMVLAAAIFAFAPQRSQAALGFGGSGIDQSGRYEYSELADQVLPSVVTVYVKQSVQAQLADQQSQMDRLRGFFRDNPDFRQLFPNMPDMGPDGGSGPTPQQPDLYGLDHQFLPTSSGSGIIVSSDGYILTNHHVLTQGLDQAQKAIDPEKTQVTIVLSDGTEISGKDVKVIYSHPLADLALIKINKTGLKAIKWGDSDKLRVGERVAAIGSPLDLKATITQGIICAKNRDIDVMSHLIQTDAVINPGSSGGALVNLDGELIGVNRLITSNTGRWQGFGFAIPSNDAKWFTDEVIKNGEIQFGYLGVRMYDDGPEKMRILATSGMEPDAEGVLIQSLPDDTGPNPARKGGLEVGDLIVSVDGKKIDGNSALQDYIKRQPAGKTIEVVVMRADANMKPEKKTLQVTLVRRPDESVLSGVRPAGPNGGGQQEAPAPKKPDTSQQLGLQLEPATGPGGTKGLKITAIEDGSPAAEAGLKVGDILLELNRKPVGSLDELKSAIDARVDNHAHYLKFLRDGSEQITTVAPPAK